MTDKKLRLTVFGPDGKEWEVDIEKGGAATLGNILGCSVGIDGPVPFMFTLIGWDESQDRYVLHLTDAIKGELYVDGGTKRLSDCIRDRSAQGVESLGIWTLVLPVPCSGYLTAAGVVLHFELGVEIRKSDIRPILDAANENRTSVEVTYIRRSS
ncbi:hypothetical protein HZC53_01340 [Candidatus Uhrbacteria bacterium]|nr:hypothetical protein [Candidatus Uhrbacteria bacterium]